jgi:cation transport regulator
MPYKDLNDLPYLIKDELPKHAQEIWMKAYNNAYSEYAKPEERRDPKDTRETVANKVHGPPWTRNTRRTLSRANG